MVTKERSKSVSVGVNYEIVDDKTGKVYTETRGTLALDGSTVEELKRAVKKEIAGDLSYNRESGKRGHVVGVVKIKGVRYVLDRNGNPATSLSKGERSNVKYGE